MISEVLTALGYEAYSVLGDAACRYNLKTEVAWSSNLSVFIYQNIVIFHYFLKISVSPNNCDTLAGTELPV